jgi:hypothetical protein
MGLFKMKTNITSHTHTYKQKPCKCLHSLLTKKEKRTFPSLSNHVLVSVLFDCNYMCLWFSLVAQLVKNPPAMWKTWVWSLGWDDPLEKGKATHSNSPAWRIPRTI